MSEPDIPALRASIDSLFRRLANTVEAHARSADGGGITASHQRRRLAVAEQPGVEEVGTLAAGLQREAAEAQRRAAQRQVDEREGELLHVI